jgi:hypothetical protein
MAEDGKGEKILERFPYILHPGGFCEIFKDNNYSMVSFANRFFG